MFFGIQKVFQNYQIPTPWWFLRALLKKCLWPGIKCVNARMTFWGRAWSGRPKFGKSTTICWNHLLANCKGMVVRPAWQIDVGLKDWGLASQNEVWPHIKWSGFTECGLVSLHQAWPHRMMSGLPEWAKPSQNEVWPPKMWPGFIECGLVS